MCDDLALYNGLFELARDCWRTCWLLRDELANLQSNLQTEDFQANLELLKSRIAELGSGGLATKNVSKCCIMRWMVRAYERERERERELHSQHVRM